MSDSCKIQMDGGILDIGTRYAIYGTALLTFALGGLAMFSVNHTITTRAAGARVSLLMSPTQLDDEMYDSIRTHKKHVRPVSTTLNLTGAAMVCAAAVLQSNPIQTQAQEVQESDPNNSQGPFTLFHAYTLLSLLWLITLTGMMIHVHTWLFNLTRRQRGSVKRDKRRFINCIWNGTHWYLIQVELMGIYGYYVCTHRDAFPPPPCHISVFDNTTFRTFAKIIYIIAMIPVVNIMLLCAVFVGSVWLLSLAATYLSNHEHKGRVVPPMVFHFFWFLTCGAIMLVIGTTTEVLLFTNTNSQNLWTFGSLLALILLLVPAETFIGELYEVLAPEELRKSVKESFGTHRFHDIKTSVDEAANGLLHGHERPASTLSPSIPGTWSTRHSGN